MVTSVEGIFGPSCTYMRKWFYSGHQSDLRCWHWQVRYNNVHLHFTLLSSLYNALVWIGGLYWFALNCRVNKPYLPIAAGDLSKQSAWFLVLLLAAAGIVTVGLNFGPFITKLYCLGLFLGTIYSVPPFRMKRFPVIAFLIIATVQFF